MDNDIKKLAGEIGNSSENFDNRILILQGRW